MIQKNKKKFGEKVITFLRVKTYKLIKIDFKYRKLILRTELMIDLLRQMI